MFREGESALMNMLQKFSAILPLLISLVAAAQQGPKPKPVPQNNSVTVVARVDMQNLFTDDTYSVPIFTPSADSDSMYRMSVYVSAHCAGLATGTSFYWRSWLEFFDQIGQNDSGGSPHPLMKKFASEPQTLPCRYELDPSDPMPLTAEPGFAQYTFRTLAGSQVYFWIYPIYLPNDASLTYDLHVIVEKL
jgi:hypothetical protein